MKFLAIALLLLTSACATTGYQEPVPVTGDGLDHCPKAECPKHPVDKDPR